MAARKRASRPRTANSRKKKAPTTRRTAGSASKSRRKSPPRASKVARSPGRSALPRKTRKKPKARQIAKANRKSPTPRPRTAARRPAGAAKRAPCQRRRRRRPSRSRPASAAWPSGEPPRWSQAQPRSVRSPSRPRLPRPRPSPTVVMSSRRICSRPAARSGCAGRSDMRARIAIRGARHKHAGASQRRWCGAWRRQRTAS